MASEEVARSLERSRAIRGGHRGVVTKLVHEAEGILMNGSLTPDHRSKLTVINRQLDGKLRLLSDMDEKILNLCEVDAIESEVNESEAIVAKVIDCKLKIEKSSVEPSPAVPSSSSAIVAPPVAPAKARLPKLTLPKFKGDVKNWTSFWDSFQSAVHNNDSIPKVDKFNYLNSLLEGTAYKTVQGLPLTESNYDSAIAMLKDRFGDPQQIISAHVDGLMKIANCVSERPGSLRVVFDKIMVHVRGLEALEVTPEQYGSFLIPVIMAKLPNDIRLRIARETGRDSWKIDNVLKIIKQEVEAREVSEGAAITKTTTSVPPRAPPTMNSFLANSRKPHCVYCEGEHFSASCMKVTEVKERRDILLKAGRCFNCLKLRHKSKDCDNPRSCRHCNRRHHQSICEKQPLPPKSDDVEQTVNATASTDSKPNKGKRVILLQTARAVAVGPAGRVPIRILFDSGSQLSYITKTLKERLGIEPLRKEKLHLNTFGSATFDSRSCDVVRFQIQASNGGEFLEVVAYTSPVICSSLPAVVNACEYEHLDGLELADGDSLDSKKSIDVLVGSDYYWSIVTGDTVAGDGGPVALGSKLGWLLSGPLNDYDSTMIVQANLVITPDVINPIVRDKDDVLSSMLHRFWDTESLGIIDKDGDDESPTFLQRLQFNHKRYEVALPWKENHPDIPDHFLLSLNRLRYLQRKLLKSPPLLEEYDSIIREQLKSGIVEPVVESVVNPPEANTVVNLKHSVHYLPHHGVIRQDKQTTKLRIVYDGSAKTTSDTVSLNDCLKTGPNLIPKLFDILIRFRWHSIALTADIEKAFLNIEITPSDRDMLRFLWVEDPLDANSHVLHLRFARLVFGLRPSPAILGSVISHHLEKYQLKYPEVIPAIRDSFYVDDMISGGRTVDEAFKIYGVAKQVMFDGGFNLRKWNSNSPELLSRIASSFGQSGNDSGMCTMYGKGEVPSQLVGSSSQGTDQLKLLGIIWKSESDHFTFCFSEIVSLVSKLPATRRSLLKVTSSIFDPLGFLSPFVIRLKILFQTLCCKELGWDQPLEGKSLKQWNEILGEFTVLNDVQVPRCYFDGQLVPDVIEFHGFSDASEQAYAAVLYLRVINTNGTVVTRLVASKTRVAPLKKQSVPRLELLGTLILTRLVATVLKNCPQEFNVTYWTDSTTALYWIKSDKMWKQYVSRRVHEIRANAMRDQWRHCPGSLNPADFPSRGLSAQKLFDCTVWWEGPLFLKLHSKDWPQQIEPHSVAALTELVKSPQPQTHALAAVTGNTLNLHEIIDCQRYSSLNRLLRVTARVLRFVEVTRERRLGGSNVQYDATLDAMELNKAEVLWICCIQAQAFEREIAYLKGSTTTGKPHYIDQFGLFLDGQNLLKCRGRINKARLSTAEKNPILLPPKHQVVKLLVTDMHTRVKHGGVNDTLVALRERYWILRGRQVVKKIVRSCVVCRKIEGLPYCSHPSPDLPTCRVSDDPPFAHTGLDFAGPLYYSESTDDRDTSKAYICLFTCASTRAIHLELTRGMNVNSFLLAFRRFVGRRGLPATLLSDNAKTFKSSAKEIRTICRSPEVYQYLTDQRTSWKFIVPRAPWWGGFWERMVRSVKRCLKKIVGRTTLKFEELATLLIEIESVINARPLTYVYDDQEGISYALTPAHLIYGRRLATTPNASHLEVCSTHKTLTKRSRNQRHLLMQLINCWRKDYLLNLREFRGSKVKNQQPVVNVGDVVILKDDSVKRVFWKLGRIIELLRSSDGKARAALVNVANESGIPKVLRRSIVQLIPIEAANTEKETATTTDSSRISPEASGTEAVTEPADHDAAALTDSHSSRPRRQAAILGEAVRRTWTGY